MRYKRNEREWVQVRDNEIWKIEEKPNQIMKALKLSYDHLPSHLKQCFAFCPVFPKDYVMEKETLIQLWMAQGFINIIQTTTSSSGPSMEDTGEQYFNELVWGSFFQDVREDYIRGLTYCKMHDLARLVAGDECMVVDQRKSSSRNIINPTAFAERVRHLAILAVMVIIRGIC
uniref:Disease resistance protein winged helix domain-containing protein n=1 Tax=Nelumbo nucifera TaxID=4432 RepID=A0A822ZKT8_NELNU|nr:TPA_asm: hypothetical protein HUJ06_000598 [Nelumbo nucifera]